MKATTTYNRSEIMKSAWRLYRTMKVWRSKGFGYCLKQAWSVARMEVVEARKEEARKIASEKSMAEFNEAKKTWKADTTDYTSFFSTERSVITNTYWGD